MPDDDPEMVLVRRADLRNALYPCSCEMCARLLAVVNGEATTVDPCRSCASCERELSAVRLELQAVVRERDQYRDALERVAVICEDAASDACDCEGYYKCGTCPARIANRADDAVEVARAALGGTE